MFPRILSAMLLSVTSTQSNPNTFRMLRSVASSAVRRGAPSRALARAMATKAGNDYDVMVVGGGPGGYAAAIKAGQMGMKVVCVEKRGKLGGTCLNVGCIPSKALLHASHYYHEAEHNFAKLGIKTGELSIDFPQMMAQKSKAVTGLTSGIEGLFKKNKVVYVKGAAKLTGPNTVMASLLEGGEQQITADKIIIATGSEPAKLPGIEVDNKSIVDSTGALSLEKIPETMIVIGGGVIGLELGSVYARLGTKVTVVEYLDRLVPGNDKEIAESFKRVLTKQGFKFKMKTKCMSAKNVDGGVELTVEPSAGGAAEVLKADIVLVSTGRRPYTEGLGLEDVGIKMDRGMITTGDHFQTNVPSIFAVGDVIKGPMLAHKAEDEALACVELMAGKAGHINYNAIPGVIYTHPEVASVGMTEEQLIEAGISYTKGKFPFMANSRARTNDDAEGMVKVLTDKNTDRLLGVHIIGTSAGELIAECVLAMEYGASAEDLGRTCHAHPTLSEAVREACMDAYDKPIHF